MDRVTYPLGSRWAFGAHGLGLVKEVNEEEIVLLLKNATVRLPLRKAEHRLRRPMSAREAKKILALMKEPSEPKSREPWARRWRAYQEKLTLGLPEEMARLYRDLGRRLDLTWSERRIYDQAHDLIMAELELLWPDAEKRIKKAAGSCR